MATDNNNNMFTPHDRNHDIATLRQLPPLFACSICALAIILFIPKAYPLAMVFSLVLMALWLMVFLQPGVALLVIVIPGLSFWIFVPQFILILPLLVAIVWQAVLLMRTFISANNLTREQLNFYRAAPLLRYCILVLSLVFLNTGLRALPSASSLPLFACSCFLFVYATWIGMRVPGVPGSPSKSSSRSPVTLEANGDSSNNIQTVAFPFSHRNENRSDLAIVQFPWIIHCYALCSTAMLLMFLKEQPPLTDKDKMDAYCILLITICAFGFAVPFYHHFLLSPVRLHLRPDASIWVETIGRTYVYGKVSRVVLNSAMFAPRETNSCHVNNTDYMTQNAVVELKDGTRLYVTPENRADFINAVGQAISQGDELDQSSPLV